MDLSGSLTPPLPRNRFADLRLVLISLLLLVIGLQFWAGSRYPSLDGKAAAGADANIGMLSFEPSLDEFRGGQLVSKERVRLTLPDLAVFERSLRVTGDWLLGNWRGMTFGLLFAAAIMALLTLLGPIQLKSGLANAVLGTIVGAPLGVCVNCAAPIALGMQSRGTRLETSLAAMIASPTLNVIILGMMFAMFPLWMVATKLVATFLFLMIGIPLVTALVAPGKAAQAPLGVASDLNLVAGDTVPISTRLDDWRAAALWVGKTFGRHLRYVAVRAVPLMILAGFLGAFAVSWLPWDTLASLLPTEGVRVAVALVGVAAFGLFLPVPIAFDVILTAVLLALGLPARYAMVLLFTLGIYSIYSAFIVEQMASWRLAAALFVALVGVGAATGPIADVLSRQQMAGQKVFLNEAFSVPMDWSAFRVEKPAAAATGRLEQRIRRGARPAPATRAAGVGALPDMPAPNRAGRFLRHGGARFGLDRPTGERVGRPMFPYASHAGSIAAGDIHGDGWPDLVVASDPDAGGIALFANVEGPDGTRRFQRQAVGLGPLDSLYVSTAMLADLDGDAALDIVFSTWAQGTFVAYNRGGRFPADAVQPLPSTADAFVAAIDAGDIDRDGDIDLVIGNWTNGYMNRRAFAVSETSRDFVLLNEGGSFRRVMLEGPPGETLTMTMTDWDQDGWLDLIIGNDFPNGPDAFYRNDEGTLRRIRIDDDVVTDPTTMTTMSIASADLDNDLRYEIYLAEIAQGDVNTVRDRNRRAEDVCAEMSGEDEAQCLRVLNRYQVAMMARRTGRFEPCLGYPSRPMQQGCLFEAAIQLDVNALLGAPRDTSPCRDILAAHGGLYADICRRSFSGRASRKPTPYDLPQVKKTNVLFQRDADGRLVDIFDEDQMEITEWSWNAKFADLDHNRWQDLYVVNGFLLNRFNGSNQAFAGVGGGRFQKRTEALGLGSHVPTGAYAFTDFDRDGDLDVITVPYIGPMQVFENQAATGNAVTFELRDGRGNAFGIGSTVTVRLADGSQQIREVKTGGGFLSFDEPVAHFGLGDADAVDAVTVTWSTGETTALPGPFAAGHRYVLSRGR